MSVHAQGIKTVQAEGGGGVKEWQNSVHVVVERPLTNFCKKRHNSAEKIAILRKNSISRDYLIALDCN